MAQYGRERKGRGGEGKEEGGVERGREGKGEKRGSGGEGAVKRDEGTYMGIGYMCTYIRKGNYK